MDFGEVHIVLAVTQPCEEVAWLLSPPELAKDVLLVT